MLVMMKTYIIIFCSSLILINSSAQPLKNIYGSYSVNRPDINIVNTAAKKYPANIWQYPQNKDIDTASFGFSIYGVPWGGKLTRALEKVEPPAIVNISSLNIGVLIICPREFRHNNMPFNLNIYKKCNHFIPTNIDVILLQKENGKLIWKTNIDLSGIFTIDDDEKYIYLSSIDYDPNTNVINQKICVLNKYNGEIIFENNGEKTSSLGILGQHVIITDKYSPGSGSVSVYNIKDNAWKKTETIDNISIDFEPFLYKENLICMKNNIISSTNINNNKINWEYKTDSVIPSSKLFSDQSNLIFSENEKIVSLNMNTGKISWNMDQKNMNLSSLFNVNDYLLICSGKNIPLKLDKKTKKLASPKISVIKFERKFKKTNLYPIDIPISKNIFNITVLDKNRKKKWIYSDEGELNSCFKIENKALLFATNKNLFAISISDGKIIKKIAFPDSGELSYNDIVLIADKIIVRNEKNVYCFNSKDYRLMYHHKFDLAWPTLCTTEVEKDNLGGDWVMSYVLMPDGKNLYADKIHAFNLYSMNYHYAMARGYEVNHSVTASAMDRQNVALQQYSAQLGMVVAWYQSVEASQIRWYMDTYSSQLMCQPYLKAETHKITQNDNDSLTVRLVTKSIDKQKFVAIEILEMATGTVKYQLLSPFQFDDYYRTWYRNPVMVWAYLGYVPVLNLKDHVLRTRLDLKSKYIYHYGPGLNTGNYIYYEDEYGFCRGKLNCIPYKPVTLKTYL